jgi:hypothetical protein
MRADRKGGPRTNDPGMYTCWNCPVEWVISEAYDLQPFEFVGPDWAQNTRFDFLGKIPERTTKDTFRAMLQNLLTERFQLAVHREKREMGVYELTVAKNGPLTTRNATRMGSQSWQPEPSWPWFLDMRVSARTTNRSRGLPERFRPVAGACHRLHWSAGQVRLHGVLGVRGQKHIRSSITWRRYRLRINAALEVLLAGIGYSRTDFL